MRPDAEKLLSLALPAVKDYALLLLDPKGTVVGWLCGAEDILGYTAAEMVGRPVSVLFTPEDLQRGLHRLELEMAGRDSAAQDDRWHVRKDGTRIWVSGSVTVVREAAGVAGFIKVLRDRTDLRIATENRAQQLQAMEEAVARTRSFLKTLGHELRNPLAPLANAAHLLPRLSTDPRIHRLAEIVANQVASMERLATDLMEVSRLEHRKLDLRLAQADLVALVQQEVDGQQLVATGSGVRLEALLPPAPVRATVDADRIRHAVANLLSNALKYTPRGGSVWAKVTVEGHDAVIRVEDTGIGIAPDMLPRIFELFTRDARAETLAPQGLGVGLAMVRQIAELHGGLAQARSGGNGRGSEFTLRLPLRGPAQQHASG